MLCEKIVGSSLTREVFKLHNVILILSKCGQALNEGTKWFYKKRWDIL